MASQTGLLQGIWKKERLTHCAVLISGYLQIYRTNSQLFPS